MKLERKNLWSLEEYGGQRESFRSQVLEHKKNRRVVLGPHVLLIFEDRLTIRYQIQEMLRIEKTFEAEGIQEELDAYNPLIPDGDNWKCSMLIQYPDAEERRKRLAELVDIENRVWVRIGESEKIFAIADEDLDRTKKDKTSAVHFLRFQFASESIDEIKLVKNIVFGIDHDSYEMEEVEVSVSIRDSLLADLAKQ